MAIITALSKAASKSTMAVSRRNNFLFQRKYSPGNYPIKTRGATARVRQLRCSVFSRTIAPNYPAKISVLLNVTWSRDTVTSELLAFKKLTIRKWSEQWIAIVVSRQSWNKTARGIDKFNHAKFRHLRYDNGGIIG